MKIFVQLKISCRYQSLICKKICSFEQQISISYLETWIEKYPGTDCSDGRMPGEALKTFQNQRIRIVDHGGVKRCEVYSGCCFRVVPHPFADHAQRNTFRFGD